MKPEEVKMAVVIAWALVWSLIAAALVSSVSSWVLVAALGALPPLLIVRMWRPPAPAVPVPVPVAIQPTRRY